MQVMLDHPDHQQSAVAAISEFVRYGGSGRGPSGVYLRALSMLEAAGALRKLPACAAGPAGDAVCRLLRALAAAHGDLQDMGVPAPLVDALASVHVQLGSVLASMLQPDGNPDAVRTRAAKLVAAYAFGSERVLGAATWLCTSGALVQLAGAISVCPREVCGVLQVGGGDWRYNELEDRVSMCRVAT